MTNVLETIAEAHSQNRASSRRNFLTSAASATGALVLGVLLPSLAEAKAAQSLRKKILRRARELISNKRNWITGKAFVFPSSSRRRLVDVQAYSANGAIFRACYDLTRYRSYITVSGKTYPITRYRYPQDFFSDAQLIEVCDINDNHGHAATLAHLDRLIEEV
jgi:hypothetical protein